MSYEFITRSVSGRIAYISLNRPDKRNALNAGAIEELHRVIADAAEDPSVRVVILRGTGGNFSAGADLQYLRTIAANSPLENAADSRRLMEMLFAWRSSLKPTIAVVEGNALAGGCGLACACDMIFAADNSRFGFTEVRIGFVPAIVARLLIDRIGRGRAMELLLRGNIITAAEAQAAGMINGLIPPDELHSYAEKVAKEIVEQTSALSIRLTKQLLWETDGLDAQEMMSQAVAFNALSRTSADFHRGVSAFINKEKIIWE